MRQEKERERERARAEMRGDSQSTDRATCYSLLWKEKESEAWKVTGSERVNETETGKKNRYEAWMNGAAGGLSALLWTLSSAGFRSSLEQVWQIEAGSLRTAMKHTVCRWWRGRCPGLPPAASLSGSGLRTEQEGVKWRPGSQRSLSHPTIPHLNEQAAH